jgi:hypothetical protein
MLDRRPQRRADSEVEHAGKHLQINLESLVIWFLAACIVMFYLKINHALLTIVLVMWHAGTLHQSKSYQYSQTVILDLPTRQDLL